MFYLVGLGLFDSKDISLKGLETLRLRMHAHCQSAQQLAQWLEQQPQVKKVYYAGLASHPQHELANRLTSSGLRSYSGRNSTDMDRLRAVARTSPQGERSPCRTGPDHRDAHDGVNSA